MKEVDIINILFEEILAFEKGSSTVENVNKLYQEWIQHTIDHFTNEEVEMIEAEFPPYPIHKEAHDNALQQMNEVFDAWQKSKEIKILKMYFIEVVPQWLVAHISSMDAMTANFIGGGMMHSGSGISTF